MTLERFRNHGTRLPDGLAVRNPGPSDADALALLLLEGYRGTVDDEGETLEEARQFVASSFKDEALLNASWLVLDGERPVSALLVRRWEARPLVTFIVTHPAHQRRKLATLLLERAVGALVSSGETEVIAAISEGTWLPKRSSAISVSLKWIARHNPVRFSDTASRHRSRAATCA